MTLIFFLDLTLHVTISSLQIKIVIFGFRAFRVISNFRTYWTITIIITIAIMVFAVVVVVVIENGRAEIHDRTSDVRSDVLWNTKKKSKFILRYTRNDTPKCITRGAHLRGLAPRQHNFEETSQRSVSKLSGTLRRFDLLGYRTRTPPTTPMCRYYHYSK